MRKKTKLVYGVGINDADYQVQKYEKVYCEKLKDYKRKLVWICPFYLKWKHMLARCYSSVTKMKAVTYDTCYCVPEWHYFLNFREWMIGQDWAGKQLDKDLLYPGNKIYGPDTCIFVDQVVNCFITERQNDRGDWPIGVNKSTYTGKFIARCSEFETGKSKTLGSFDTPEEAHLCWLSFKLNKAKQLAEKQTDPRVAKALVERYENYK